MKTFLWLIVLGIAAYFIYRRAHDYGPPWKAQVSIVDYEFNKRYVGGSEELFVNGNTQNHTRKNVRASVECKALPEGMTLTSKAATDVSMLPGERVPFHLSLKNRTGATGADCRVRKWSVEGGLEEKMGGAVKKIYTRIKSLL